MVSIFWSKGQKRVVKLLLFYLLIRLSVAFLEKFYVFKNKKSLILCPIKKENRQFKVQPFLTSSERAPVTVGQSIPGFQPVKLL